jgi:hypothetical protein
LAALSQALPLAQSATFINLLRWPPRNPDLSPIEQIWAYLKKRLKGRRFADADELFHAIAYEWEMIPGDILENFVSSSARDVWSVTGSMANL